MTDAVIAVDIGGTKTAVAVIDRDERIIDTLVAPTPGPDGPDAIIGTVVGLVSALAGRSDDDIRALGVGTAGVVDVGCGAIVSATDTLANWAGTPLAARLREELAGVIGVNGLVHVQNDVDAHALGELRRGAAVGARSALVVAVGTGVGAGIILGGAPLRGARHVAGEIAHIPTPGAEHLRCPCGRAGHLEALGSGIGMHRHYLSLGGSPAVADARGIAALALDGDPIAGRALEDSAAAVGRALAAAVTLIDPERVVVTGGVAQIGDVWWQPMERTFRAEVIDALDDVPIVPGVLGGRAPLIGAAASAWELVGEIR
ncbi:ROK family protein [Microbacterium allomyrinae]|uniref:ROK family protein n=1 Tax=Microbacterium allomyrinae TaxID=2830666 RepID=A0A9X1LU08_9MICO|nr:ROK family protein [Microbacterium allomyrinae]MCC2031490.1 ROK family protein [Microbacterium allomyrinae]